MMFWDVDHPFFFNCVLVKSIISCLLSLFSKKLANLFFCLFLFQCKYCHAHAKWWPRLTWRKSFPMAWAKLPSFCLSHCCSNLTNLLFITLSLSLVSSFWALSTISGALLVFIEHFNHKLRIQCFHPWNVEYTLGGFGF